MYKVGKGDSFYVGLKTLEMMWMCKPDRRDEGFLVYIFRTVAGFIFIFFFQVGPTLRIFMVARVYEDISISESLAVLVGGLGFSLVYFKMSAYHHRCGKVFKNLVDHKKFAKPRTFDATARRCRMLAIFFLVYCPMGILIYGALLLYENRNGVCERLQQATDQNLYCSLFLPLWLPVNISRAFIFTIQTIIGICLYTPGGQVCLLIYESTFILISHIESLVDQLDVALYEKDEKRRSWRLRYCIQYHMHISKMGEDICSLHETFTGHLAVIWAGSLGCICNQLLHSKLLASFLYLLGYLFTCCCLVEAGQTLLNKSESLADKLYNIPWYAGNIKEQKCILFMIMRAQRPMKLSDTPFGNYDCSFFIMIIKTAYSYLTLLQKTS